MQDTAPAPTSSPAARKRIRFKGEWLTGYLFILPATVLIGLFGLFPIVYAFYMSLYRWRVRQGPFVGLDNYQQLVGDWVGAASFIGGLLLVVVAHSLWIGGLRFASGWGRWGRLLGALTLLAAGIAISLGWDRLMTTGDRDYFASLVRTFYYGFISVPIQIALAITLASMLYQNIKGRDWFRMVFFLPYVTPAVAGGAVFRAIFSPREERFANQVMTDLGLPAQRWLYETEPVSELVVNYFITRFGGPGAELVNFTGFWAGPSQALLTIIIFGIWTYTGYNAVIFMAGLANIPKNLYEAAKIDGANGRQQFFHITVPMLSPVTFYLTVLGFIGTFQAFTQLYVMRSPATRDAVDTASLEIFDMFYLRNNFSMAAAQSIFLFVIILILTLYNQRILGRRRTS